jgi:hypothetical protein
MRSIIIYLFLIFRVAEDRVKPFPDLDWDRGKSDRAVRGKAMPRLTMPNELGQTVVILARL